MFVEKPSVVLCPNCKLPMTPGEPQPILFTKGLVDVPHTCGKCGAQTKRTMTATVADKSGT